MAASRETILIAREFSLFARFIAIKTMMHAYDHIAAGAASVTDRANALELIADGIQNALDERSTGREFRTLRHSYLAKTDPQNHPVVADADRRCQKCGAVNPKGFSQCWDHRPELPDADKAGL